MAPKTLLAAASLLLTLSPIAQAEVARDLLNADKPADTVATTAAQGDRVHHSYRDLTEEALDNTAVGPTTSRSFEERALEWPARPTRHSEYYNQNKRYHR